MTGPETERESYELARRIADLMLEKAATDVLVLDLRTLSSACDYFVICTAASEPQVKAIAESMKQFGFTIPILVDEAGERDWTDDPAAWTALAHVIFNLKEFALRR